MKVFAVTCTANYHLGGSGKEGIFMRSPNSDLSSSRLGATELMIMIYLVGY